MKVRTWLIFILFIPSLIIAAPNPGPKVIPLSSPIYAQLDLLYRLEGRPLPSSSRPWSTDEASLIINTLESRSALYTATKALIEGEVPSEPWDGFSFSGGTEISLEGYAHTNTSYNTPYDWIRSVDQRRPLLRLSVDASFANRLYLSTSFDIGAAHVTKGYDTELGDLDIGALILKGEPAKSIGKARQFENHFVTNFFLPNPDFTLSDWPQLSQLSLGGSWWSVTTGRGALKWGSGRSGDLIVGSHIVNHNHLKASFFNETSKLQLLYIFFPDPQFEIEQRIFLGHRVEFTPASWVRVAVSENVMYKGETILVGYLDPTYIYHNLYNPSRLNAIASVEADFAPLPSLSVHAQFALDQFQLPNEDASEANAMGVLANVAYSWQGAGGYWTATAEAAYTDPVLYRRDRVDFLVTRELQNNSNLLLVDYLGYGWGSDGQLYQARVEYLKPDILSAEAAVTLHRQGEVTFTGSHNKGDDNTKNANIWGPAPYGDKITERLILSLSGSWLPPLKGLEVYGRLDWIGKRNYNRQTKNSDYSGDLQFSIGVTKRF
jgi:hypothetical protein